MPPARLLHTLIPLLLLATLALAQNAPAGQACVNNIDCHSSICTEKVCVGKFAAAGEICYDDFAAEDCQSG